MGVIAAVFARPLAEVALGIVAAGALTPARVGALLAYAALMLGVCLLACVVPTRRALRVQPTEALRAEV
jgi:putative ABC transport system permease protein